MYCNRIQRSRVGQIASAMPPHQSAALDVSPDAVVGLRRTSLTHPTSLIKELEEIAKKEFATDLDK